MICGRRPKLPDRGLVVITRDVHDLHLVEAEALLQCALQLGIGAARGPDRDAHDALVLGLPQEARDLGLREAQARGDLGLLEALVVVEPSHAGHQSQLVDTRHLKLPAPRAPPRRCRSRCQPGPLQQEVDGAGGGEAREAEDAHRHRVLGDDDLRHGAPEAAADDVLLGGDDGARLARGRDDGVAVDGAGGGHVQDARLDALARPARPLPPAPG